MDALSPAPTRACATRDPVEVAAWLRLAATPGLRPSAAHRLLAVFGGPRAVVAQDAATLRAVVPASLARVLASPPDAAMAALTERTLAWLAAPGHHFLALRDDAYPSRLLHLADPPPVVYVNGNLEVLARPALAVVGARGATAQGARDAQAFASAISAAGLTVVSGMALGVDAAAHAGAMGGPGGTIAVIGTGADLVYPARHHALAHQIVEQGAIMSEFPLGTPAISHNFPRRNRLIAALAHGVLVVEAAERSGSLITARLAADLGREVFAVPGSIHAPLSRGCHVLIRQGAKLVETPEDIFEELTGLLPAARTATRAGAPATAARGKATASRGTPASRERSRQRTAHPRTQCGESDVPAAARANAPGPLADALGAALAYDPVTLDALCERSGLAPEAASAALLQLELEGAVERLPGNLYRRLG